MPRRLPLFVVLLAACLVPPVGHHQAAGTASVRRFREPATDRIRVARCTGS